MATFIAEIDCDPERPRFAVKDIIDVAGVPTTGGSKLLADAPPAGRDAACVRNIRAGGATVNGKANLQELCAGPIGVNPWFGDPVNPLDPDLIPGGSSSGSAVAVATRRSEYAIGSDSAGSIRIPAACCGVAGLKPTTGRISLDGVMKLAPTLDTVGPMARSVEELADAVRLMDPTFAQGVPAVAVGRLHGFDADPRIDLAVTAAVAAAGLAMVPVELPSFDAAFGAGGTIAFYESFVSISSLVGDRTDLVGPAPSNVLALGPAIGAEAYRAALQVRAEWIDEVAALFGVVDLLVMPTLPIFPPKLSEADAALIDLGRGTLPWNLAGTPALAMPVPCADGIASLQVIGPHGADEIVVMTARSIERAVGRAA